MALPETFRILRSEHANIGRVLVMLEGQVAVATRGEQPNLEIVEAIAKYFMQYPDKCHHPKEDLVLAKLKQRLPDQVAEFERIEAEHKEVAARSAKFAESIAANRTGGTAKAFEQLAEEFISFERAHMTREDRHLMPRALEVLTEDDWAEIDAAVLREDDPLFGPEAAAPFKALRNLIMRGRR